MIPHVFIGLVIPFFMGGIIWEFIAIWPYYLRAYQLSVKFRELRDVKTQSPESPEVESAPSSGSITASEGSVLGNIIKMHSAQELKRTISNPIVVQGRVVAQSSGTAVEASHQGAVVVSPVIVAGVVTNEEDNESNINLENNTNLDIQGAQSSGKNVNL